MKFKNDKKRKFLSMSSSIGHTNSKDNEVKIRLPIHDARSRFVAEYKKNPALILMGETGSGKTTQIPQFLYQSGLTINGVIAVTQPRRVAAISVAKRVSEEMGICLGSLVGYRVRFEDVSDPLKTKILFQTDGMLLREAIVSPQLDRYSTIILDEAHERTINTDILFGIIKAAMLCRKIHNPLKVIVMSATMNATKFSHFFNGAPILYVSGRPFPVNIYHASTPLLDWNTNILKTIFQIHETANPREDILTFLTGQEDIENMARSIRQISKDLPRIPLIVVPLYASQPSEAQSKAFLTTPPGARKVILATNIAETSLTLPGIHHVIDSCRIKSKVHLPTTGLDILKVVTISKAQAVQRSGRAGRTHEGHCYRLLTKKEYDELDSESVPEILRCNLTHVLLQIKSISSSEISKFDFLEPPPNEALDGALRTLKILGALNENSLTPLGKSLASFPLDPRYSKMILSSPKYGCSEEILTIVSMLNGDNLMINSSSDRENIENNRKKFICSEGDHITLLKIYRAFVANANRKEFCKTHYFNFRNLQFAVQVRKQLMELCRKENISIQSSGNQTDLIRQCLITGLFMNVARLTREGHYVTLDTQQKVKIHPSSVLFRSKPEFVIFTEMISTEQTYIRDLSLVDSLWLKNEQPEYFQTHRVLDGIY